MFVDATGGYVQYGRTALHWACEQGEMDAAEMLIDLGCNTFVEDAGGNRPLDLLEDADSREFLEDLAASRRVGKEGDFEDEGDVADAEDFGDDKDFDDDDEEEAEEEDDGK